MTTEIQDKIKSISNQLNPIFDRYKVTKAGLFGSIIRGEDKEGSDVDILIEFHPTAEISLLDFVHVKNALQDVLGKNVDLVHYHTVKPALKKYILPNEVRIYEKNY